MMKEMMKIEMMKDKKKFKIFFNLGLKVLNFYQNLKIINFSVGHSLTQHVYNVFPV